MSKQLQKLHGLRHASRISRRDFLKLMSGAAAATVAGSMFTSNSALRSLAAQASPSGHLSVYSALNESTNNAFVAAFQKAYPQVQVDLLPIAAAGDLETRIRTEKDSPKADVFIGGSSEFHSPLGTEGLTVPYKSPNATAVDDQFKDPDGYWTGWYIGIFGFVYNTDRFAKEMAGAKPPATWDDLLDPAWKGKLAMPDQVKTGGGYIFLATQIFRFAVSLGIVQAPAMAATAAATMAAPAATAQAVDYSKAEAAAMDFMKKLNGNIAQYVGTAPQGIQLVGQGQFVGCPNWSHDILTAKAQKQPIELANPAQTGFEIGGISIVKGGPNLDAAKAFVDWVLSKDAGELNVKLSNRDSVRKDVAPAPGAPTLDKVSLVPYDRTWATANKDRLLKLWQAAIS